MRRRTARDRSEVYLLLVFLALVVAACGSASSSIGTPCAAQGECGMGQICRTGTCTDATAELYDFTDEINVKAQVFLEGVKARQLNVVTAESLTAGMIISSLVNVPNYGSYLYGGFATYDSDAKRQFLGVKVGDVYTKECSLQMAIGALTHSRALVGVAVTGKAGPVAKTDLQSLGTVDVGVAIRTDVAAAGSDLPTDTSFPQTFTSVSRRINTCAADGHQVTRDVCEKYKIEAAADERGFVSDGVLRLVRKLIRQDTVIAALTLGSSHLGTYNCQTVGGTVLCPDLSQLCTADYDGRYTEFGEPNWVISQHAWQTRCPSR